jgi:hypothetical protein
MIRRTLSTISAAAVLALGAAAPAVACEQPSSGTASPQAQQEHAKSADKGSFRHHHGDRGRFEQQAQGSDRESSQASNHESSQQDQQQNHGDQQD